MDSTKYPEAECRHLTAMATPLVTLQWKVLVMGLRNGNAIFQRVMEFVLKDIPNADAYVDDIIVGSEGDTPEEVLENHKRDLDRVCEVLKANQLVADPKKSTPVHG